MLTQLMQRVLHDPTAHDSLKTCIRALADCDPVDAEVDAAHLAELMISQVYALERANERRRPHHD